MKKVILLVLASLTVLVLVLTSCGQASTTTASGTTSKPATGTSKPPTTTSTGAKPTPVYGGTLNVAIGADPTAWDPTKAQAIRVGHMFFTSNKLIQGDWTKGPQGSGVTGWEWGYLGDVNLLTGELASSWELPDSTTIIYHINKNAHFQNKAPANGRAVTADDVVWNMQMQFNYPGVWQSMTYPPDKPAAVTGSLLPGDPRRPSSFTALDKSTVQVKVPSTSQNIMFLEIACNAYTNPPEVWTSGGDMTNWKNVVGSGSWVLSDYVSGSALTYAKNPNYWETDPLYPGKNYTWPYADSLKELIITDAATRLTAIRTGKIDLYVGLVHDDAMPLMNDLKNLQSKKRINVDYILSGRVDQKPFDDIRVRQALNMAVDKQSWLKDYLKGDGELLGYPYPSDPAWSKYYTPMDQQPADVQMLYKYDVTKAKQLLADAGYPNGFKTTAEVWSNQPQADEVSALAGYLSKIGVTVDIKIDDPATYNSRDAANDFTGMWYGQGKGIWAPNEQLMTKKDIYSNKAHLNDPYYTQVGTVIAANMVSHPDVYFKTMKDAGVYELKSAWGIFMPAPYTYNVWWPWVGNYLGIGWTGWAGVWQWTKSIWIDGNMKKSMGF